MLSMMPRDIHWLTPQLVLPQGADAPLLQAFRRHSRCYTPGYTSLLSLLSDALDWPHANWAPSLVQALQLPTMEQMYWYLASPVYYQADRDTLRLQDIENLGGIAEPESAQLTQDFVQFYADLGLALKMLSPTLYLVALPFDLQFDPLWKMELADLDEAFRQQESHPHWAKFAPWFNESQMWFHQHPVNRQRDLQGLPLVNGLWFWGRGGKVQNLTRHWQVIGELPPALAALGLQQLDDYDQLDRQKSLLVIDPKQDENDAENHQAWWFLPKLNQLMTLQKNTTRNLYWYRATEHCRRSAKGFWQFWRKD